MDKFQAVTSGILLFTGCLIYLLGLTAGLALVSSVGLSYLFIGLIKSMLERRDRMWAIIDIGISLGLGFTGTLMAGLTIGGSTGLLAGLIVSLYLSFNIKGQFTVSQLLLGIFKRNRKTTAVTVWPGPDD